MSFEEISSIIKADNEKQKRILELERTNWFYTVIAQQGNEKIQKPEDLVRFEWEIKSKKEIKKLTKEQIRTKGDKAIKWQKNR